MIVGGEAVLDRTDESIEPMVGHVGGHDPEARDVRIVAALGVRRPVAQAGADIPVRAFRAVLQEWLIVRAVIEFRTRARIGEQSVRRWTSIVRVRDAIEINGANDQCKQFDHCVFILINFTLN